MKHLACAVHCLTGQAVIDEEDFTPSGYLEIICGVTVSLDAPRTLSKGGFNNYYFSDGSRALSQSFVMRDGS